MRGFHLRGLRALIPDFRLYDFSEGRPVLRWETAEGRCFRLDPEVSLSFWNLFWNPRGNRLLWEESVLRSLIENPADSELGRWAFRCACARRDSSTAIPPEARRAAGCFRLSLESFRGETLVELQLNPRDAQESHT